MRELNHGNVLPFYTYNANLSLQSDKYFTDHGTSHNVGGHTNYLLPFQYVGNEYLFFDLYRSIDNTFITTLTLDVANTLDGLTFIQTYNATTNLGLTECAIYHIVGRTFFNVKKIVSENIFVKSNWKHSITFTNATDIGKVFYQQGYQQTIYEDLYEDYPIIDLKQEAKITLTGDELIMSSRQVEKRVLNGFFLDSQLSALTSIGLHSSITISEVNPSQTIAVKRIEFTSKPSPDESNFGTFTFEVDVISKTGCGANTYSV